MAGVAHTPHLEKRPSGYFFRRRLPKAWVEISNPGQSSAICLSLRTDVLSEATCRVRALTALTDLAVALTTERPVDHLSPEHVTLLTELARCQIAAHEALRASAEPRSEAAANFAAQTERATQDMLRRALALGDRSPVTDPWRTSRSLLEAANLTEQSKAILAGDLEICVETAFDLYIEARSVGYRPDIRRLDTAHPLLRSWSHRHRKRVMEPTERLRPSARTSCVRHVPLTAHSDGHYAGPRVFSQRADPCFR